MPTQTFPCPFCAKKMGVGIELLGKKVRCPHCNQILVAPAPVAAPVPPAIPVAVASPPPPPPPPLPPPPETAPELPTFNLPTQEARESIFGETEDESDDVFSSSDGNKLRVPVMPVEEAPPAPPPPPPPPTIPVAVQSAALPTSPAPDPAYAATIELNENPFAGLSFEPAPAPVPPPPVAAIQAATQPVAVPMPISAPPTPTPLPIPAPAAVAPIGATPPSSSGGNPWAGMDQVSALPAALPAAIPTVVPVPLPAPVEATPFAEVETPKSSRRHSEPADDDRPARRAKPAPAGGGSALFKIGFFILAPYALIVTIAAIYGLFLKSSLPAGHPLSNLPDNFGEFPPAERKKTGRLPANLDAELPADQKVALGGTLNIGQLEIAPLGVEERKLKIVIEGKSGGKPSTETTSTAAIVLKMRIKNTSDDLMIHPLDPAFNRRVTGSERIATNLVVGNRAIQGGAIEWPLNEKIRRKYEEAQANDATPLKPGEAREFVLFSNANQQVVKAVKEARDGVLWRVQLRRGRIDFDGKDIPVTAIIGVEFKPSDVKTPD